jgi:acyl carrier protein
MLTAPTLAQIESIVHGRIRAAVAERAGEAGPLSGSEKLGSTLGLSSLDLAFLVAELEAELGVDPFAKLVSITSVRSVADLVRAYQQVFFPELRRSGEDDAIAAATERARTRRARRERRDERE